MDTIIDKILIILYNNDNINVIIIYNSKRVYYTGSIIYQ